MSYKKLKTFGALTTLAMAMADCTRKCYGTPYIAYREDNNNYKANFNHEPKQLREFKIKGVSVMAYSKKDAIKRINHSKLTNLNSK